MTAFILKPSRYSLFSLLGITLICMLAVSAWSASIIIKIMSCLMIIAYAYFIARRYIFLQHKHAIQALYYDRDGTWQIKTNASNLTAELLGSSTVTRLVCILRFKLPSKRWLNTCIVLPDAILQGNYRQLMMCAKLG